MHVCTTDTACLSEQESENQIHRQSDGRRLEGGVETAGRQTGNDGVNKETREQGNRRKAKKKQDRNS